MGNFKELEALLGAIVDGYHVSAFTPTLSLESANNQPDDAPLFLHHLDELHFLLQTPHVRLHRLVAAHPFEALGHQEHLCQDLLLADVPILPIPLVLVHPKQGVEKIHTVQAVLICHISHVV